MRLFLCLFLLLAPMSAMAHETTRSYLTVSRNQTTLTAELRVAFRDIEVAVWLDDNLDGQITWAETTARLPQIMAYVTAALQFEAGGACPLQVTGQGASNSGGIAFLDLRFTGTCPAADAPLRATARLFADIDPDHRVFLTATTGAVAVTAMLGAAEPAITMDAASAGAIPTFLAYAQAGIAHLIGGADHIVFLFVLILPAVAMAASPRHAVRDVLLAATGFTIAHALTLTAATLEVLRPRSDVIELLVALSIIVTAADNIRPFLPAPRAVVAAFFGLIHGFGFATALAGFSLPSGTLAVALLGFNIGIEVAQIAIILLMMPALYVLRAGPVQVWLGSGAAILIALYWSGLRLSVWL
jgi:HupE / UreJ protein